MKKGLTEIVFVLDKSGSMGGLEKDTIGGFNSTIEKQRKVDGEAYVTTVLFSDGARVIHDRVPLTDVEPMTEAQYFVGGCTALLDAVGTTIKRVEFIHKHAREEDVPEHTIFVITTDGYENSSRKFTAAQIKKLITEKREKHGWDFIFLGANIDSVTTAESYGIPSDTVADFIPDSEGVATCFKLADITLGELRLPNSACRTPLSKLREDNSRSRTSPSSLSEMITRFNLNVPMDDLDFGDGGFDDLDDEAIDEEVFLK